MADKPTRLLRKWDEEAHTYKPRLVPASWNVKAASDDMDEIVNCPHCGKELPYGKTYTSMQFHARMGMGYAVCEDCYYGIEWPERRQRMRQKKGIEALVVLKAAFKTFSTYGNYDYAESKAIGFVKRCDISPEDDFTKNIPISTIEKTAYAMLDKDAEKVFWSYIEEIGRTGKL